MSHEFHVRIHSFLTHPVQASSNKPSVGKYIITALTTVFGKIGHLLWRQMMMHAYLMIRYKWQP